MSTQRVEFNLFGALTKKAEVRDVWTGRRYRSRATLTFVAPDLTFRADANEIAKGVGEAIAATISTNMTQGRDPTGQPLPQPSPATLARRRYRQAQASRGGLAHPRFKNERVRMRINRRFARRFRAPSLGYFPPDGSLGGGQWFGVESGMMALGIRAVPEGGVWTLYFPTPRAVGRNESAVQRVFTRIPFWSAEAMSQPLVQGALQQFARSLIGHRISRFLQELRNLGQSSYSVLQTVAGQTGQNQGEF